MMGSNDYYRIKTGGLSIQKQTSLHVAVREKVDWSVINWNFIIEVRAAVAV